MSTMKYAREKLNSTDTSIAFISRASTKIMPCSFFKRGIMSGNTSLPLTCRPTM